MRTASYLAAISACILFTSATLTSCAGRAASVHTTTTSSVIVPIQDSVSVGFDSKGLTVGIPHGGIYRLDSSQFTELDGTNTSHISPEALEGDERKAIIAGVQGVVELGYYDELAKSKSPSELQSLLSGLTIARPLRADVEGRNDLVVYLLPVLRGDTLIAAGRVTKSASGELEFRDGQFLTGDNPAAQIWKLYPALSRPDSEHIATLVPELGRQHGAYRRVISNAAGNPGGPLSFYWEGAEGRDRYILHSSGRVFEVQDSHSIQGVGASGNNKSLKLIGRYTR